MCWRGTPLFHCRLKGLLFWKIWTLEGKDLDLWVSGSVAWKSQGREKLSGFPAVIGISLLLGKWRRGMLCSLKSVSSPHMLSWMLAAWLGSKLSLQWVSKKWDRCAGEMASSQSTCCSQLSLTPVPPAPTDALFWLP